MPSGVDSLFRWAMPFGLPSPSPKGGVLTCLTYRPSEMLLGCPQTFLGVGASLLPVGGWFHKRNALRVLAAYSGGQFTFGFAELPLKRWYTHFH